MVHKEIIVSSSVEMTEQAGGAFAETLRPGDVIALCGGLGAGKTAFVRGAAARLVLGARVTSPTYSIVNTYNDAGTTVHHFDMYRVDSAASLESTGFYDYLDGGGVIFIEWFENIASFFGSATHMVSVDASGGEYERTITIETMR